jgi:hypothetical protein
MCSLTLQPPPCLTATAGIYNEREEKEKEKNLYPSSAQPNSTAMCDVQAIYRTYSRIHMSLAGPATASSKQTSYVDSSACRRCRGSPVTDENEPRTLDGGFSSRRMVHALYKEPLSYSCKIQPPIARKDTSVYRNERRLSYKGFQWNADREPRSGD